jgi:signal transduction histidine kinase
MLLGYVYWANTNYVRGGSDRATATEYALLLQVYDEAGRDGLIGFIKQRFAPRDVKDGIYLLSNPSFASLAGNLKTWPAAARGGHGWINFTVPNLNSKPPEITLGRVTYRTLPDGSHLLVGRAIDDLDEFVGTIRSALACGAMLTFILAAVAGVFVTRRTVGRIETINATTRNIMRSDLGRRIPLRGTKDEWDQLAENLNSMLDRIEELVAEVRQVSDNVAHDLRTPITRLQGRLERAYHHGLDTERYHALGGDTIRELNTILSTFASLLRIGRIETLDPRSAFRVVDLSEIAGDVTELFDAAAEEKGSRVKLVSRGRVSVRGDRDLLFDAISNLIDNAIKHGAGDIILVEVMTESQGPMIVIADHGPGIPVEEHKQVLKRFYRLDRSRRTPGNGLGLSLVAAVALQHDALIEMADNQPGLRIQLRFPPVVAQNMT